MSLQYIIQARYKSRVTAKWRLPQHRVINAITSDVCRVVSVQHVRAAVHQLHERASAAVLQPPHVRAGAGDLQEGRHQLGVHRLRNGSCRLYRAHREGTPSVDNALTGGCLFHRGIIFESCLSCLSCIGQKQREMSTSKQ